jgi:hypothetical protein
VVAVLSVVGVVAALVLAGGSPKPKAAAAARSTDLEGVETADIRLGDDGGGGDSSTAAPPAERSLSLEPVEVPVGQLTKAEEEVLCGCLASSEAVTLTSEA